MLATLIVPVDVSSQGASALNDDDRQVRLFGPLRVINLDDQPDRKKEVEKIAREARTTVRSGTLLDWKDTAYIIWVESNEEFEQVTSFKFEFTAAAASPARNTIWINADVWQRSTPTERKEIMTHEMGHLLLGALTEGKPIPLWANEGIVQHMAGEWNIAKSESLSVGRAIDVIPHLNDLEYEFPEVQSERELAYLISYKAIENKIKEYAPDDQIDIRVLMYQLSGNNRDRFIADLWDSDRVTQLNQITMDSIGPRVGHWLVAMFSTTTVWMLILFLVIAAWVVLRIKRAQRDREEMDEVWSKSLTKADVIDIYGPPEGEGETEELTPWDKYQMEKEQNPDPEPWRQD